MNVQGLSISTLSLCFALSSLLACDSGTEKGPESPPAAAPAEGPAPSEVEAPAASGAKAADPKAADAKAVAPGRKFNLNTASKEEFMTIPDVGPRMAHEFDEYRPYVSIAQFRKEIAKYVDAEQVTKFEAFVFVPVDFNACDDATLAQLPGVDDAAAAKLSAARPYGDSAAFLEKYEELAGQAGRGEAEAMLVSK
jgi:DNA uptake protein ComE-like DNA-binding protein